MHLRFPLPAGYFPKFELAPHETMAFQNLVNDIVKETQREQRHFLKDGKMNIDSRTWKLAKSKERLHVYRKRSASQDKLGLYGATESASSSLSRSGSESSQDGAYPRSRRGVQTRTSASASVSSSCGSASIDHESIASLAISSRTDDDDRSRKSIAPSVLGFGLLEGSLDDIIYGLHESTADEMKTMASFLGDDALIDCAVLHTLRVTQTTFVGLKWKLTRSLGGNRDVCFIESVGIAVDAHGARFGYHVLESVPVGNCPAFADNSIVRTNMSFCYVFRDVAGQPGLVDVFMMGAFDSSADALTAGGVGDNRSAIEMLFGLTRAFDAAEAKKLSLLVAKQAAAVAQQARGQTKASGSHCSICRAKPGLLSSHLVCQGCGAVICTKCRVKKVTFARTGKRKVSCCKICLVHVKDTSPFVGVTFDRQPLQALTTKKQSMASVTLAPPQVQPQSHQQQQQRSRMPPSAPVTQQQQSQQHAMLLTSESNGNSNSHGDKLQRHHSSQSITETEYAQSMQSWPSSIHSLSIASSSAYSDIEDGYYPTQQPTSAHNSQLVVLDRKMPAVSEGPGYGFQPQSQSQQQLTRYGSQDQLVARHQSSPSQHQMHYLSPAQQQQQQQQQQIQYQQYQQQQQMMPSQVMAAGTSRNGGAGTQSRAGLYNQMLELQLAAERAYNMANQNATYLTQQQQR